MSQGGDRPRIEKTLENDLKSDSIRSGFRRALYNINKGESSSHAYDVRKHAENLAKERNPQKDISGTQKNLDSLHLTSHQEKPWRGSKAWNEKWDKATGKLWEGSEQWNKIWDKARKEQEKEQQKK